MATIEEILDAAFSGDVQEISDIATEVSQQTVPVEEVNLDEAFGTEKQVEEATRPSFIEEELPKMGGGVAGGMYGFSKTPGSFPMKMAGSALGAFGGGGMGETATNVYQVMTDSPYAPKSISDALKEAYTAGGEEMMYDLLGNTIFKTGSSIYQWARPKPKPGIDDSIQLIEKFGGQLTPAQLSNNKFLETLEGLLRSTWGGGGQFKRLEDLNQKAIDNYLDDYIKNFNQVSDEILTDEGVGILFQNIYKAGDKAHSQIGGEMYKNLDDLYKTLYKPKQVTKETPTGFIDAGGNMLSKKTSQTVFEEVLPVSTKKLKDYANKVLDNAKATNYTGLASSAKSLLEKIRGFDDAVSFENAQQFRSKILSEIRIAEQAGAKGTQAAGEGGVAFTLKDISKLTDEVIEQGAVSTGNKEFIDSWRKANKWWKTGKSIFNDKLIRSYLDKNASKVGADLLNQPPEVIRAAKKAIRASAKLNKTSFTKDWQQIQQGYIRNMLGSLRNETGAISVPKLEKYFIKYTPQNKNILTTFSKEQIDGLRQFKDAIKLAETKPLTEGAFAIKIVQASLVLDIPSTLFGQGDFDFVTAGSVTIGPAALAKIMTNPTMAKRLAGLTRQSGRTRFTRAFAQTLARFLGEATKVEGEE